MLRGMKTTLLGILSAAALVLQTHLQAGRALDDWKTWLPAVCIAALGYLAVDRPKEEA